MARLFDDAASQFLKNDSAVVTAAPLTMACWFNSDDATKSQYLMTLSHYEGGATGDLFALRLAAILSMHKVTMV